MAYATQTDLFTTFGEANVRARATRGVANETAQNAVIADALEKADAVINSHISSVVNLPIAMADIPVVLKHTALDLSFVYLNTNFAQESPADMQRRDNAMMWLRDVMRGKASLGLKADNTLAPNTSAQTPEFVEQSSALPINDLINRRV